MAQYNNSVVTDAGVELLNKCEAGQSNMQMVAFVCGSGEYTDEEIQAMVDEINSIIGPVAENVSVVKR